MTASGMKAQNDPWRPMPEEAKAIVQPPANPLYQFIDSGRYIDSLEKKLQRIQGRNKKEPSSRDIINSLASLRDDGMRRFMDKEDSTCTTAISIMDSESAGSDSMSYLQRRLHPERQAINMEELFELLKDDELDRHKDDTDGIHTDGEQDRRRPQHDDELGTSKSQHGDELDMPKSQHGGELDVPKSQHDNADTHTTAHQER